MNKKPACIILALFAALCFNCFVGCSEPTPSPSPGPSVNGPTNPDEDETPDGPTNPDEDETPDGPTNPDEDETPDEPDGSEWRFNSKTVNSETTYEVNRYSGTSKNVIIPSMHEGGKVTGIAYSAFYYCDHVESIYIPESITTINFPTLSLSSENDGVFTRCTNLKNIYVSENNPDYKSVDGVLYSKNEQTLLCFPSGKEESLFVIPETVKRIGDYAFANCSNLTDIVFPSALSHIAPYAFANCSIKEFDHPNIGSLSYYAFSACKTLTKVNAPSVTEIWLGAFKNCTSLTNVTFSDDLTEIGEYAFGNCVQLKSITLPQTVERVSDDSFRGCANLSQITVEEDNLNYKSIDGSLYNKEGTTLIRATLGNEETLFNVPSEVSIGAYAFSGITRLTSITFPDGLTEIGNYAFRNCTGLTSIALPDGLTEISEYAFAQCSSLTNVSFPDGLTEIGYNAFAQCSSLTNVSFPDGLTKIGNHAFAQCSSLTNVSFPDGLTRIESGAFGTCSSLTSFHIPKNAEIIPHFGDGSLTDYSCVVNCTGITNITVDENNPYYKSIDGNLYSKDGKELIQYALGKNDTTFTIPDGTEVVGNYALAGHRFNSIIIPKSVTVMKMALLDCIGEPPLTIYYAGTETEWSKIQKVYTFNGSNYTIVYNYSPSGEN